MSSGGEVPLGDRRRAIEGEVDRLVGLGARKQIVWEQPDWFSVVMLDPEGNEFCLR